MLLVTAVGLRRPALTTVVASFGFVVTGVLLGTQATVAATTSPLREWYARAEAAGTSEAVWIEGELTRDAIPTDYGAGLDIRVARVRSSDDWVGVTGGVRVAVGGQLVARHLHQWVGGRTVRMPVSFRQPARYLNPGVADEQRALMWRGISLLGSVKSALLVEVVGPGGWWSNRTAVIRAAVRRRVARTVGRFSARSAGVVTAVLIGDRAGLAPQDRRRLQESGTYHVIAISGGNIAILVGLLIGVLRVGGCPTRAGSVVTILCLLAYASVVGPEASVRRATFATCLFLTARAVDHRSDPLNTVAVSAACLVGLDPLSIVDAGFLLTFGATVGILVGVAPLMEHAYLMVSGVGRIRSLLLPAVALVAATVCAELALFPIAAGVFSRLTVAGLLLNLAAIPLMTVTQIGGMVVVGVSGWSDLLERVAGYLTHLASSGIVESARLVDLMPWMAWRVPSPGVLLVTGYYGGWAFWLWGPSAGRLRHGAAALVVGMGLLIVSGPIDLSRGHSCGGWDDALQLVFLDVDQADATLVQFPSGQTLLVDAGGTVRGTFEVGARIVAPVLWQAGVRRLDYLAITHADPDHIGGAVAVVDDFRPREIWEGVPVPKSRALSRLRAVARRAHVGWRRLQRGDQLSFGDVVVQVWHPPRPDWERQQVRNDDSLVLEVRYGDVSFVLPGDIGAAVEFQIAGEIPSAPVRVLKVPHHGSRTSSSAMFIAALQPDVAVVSAGRTNSFGHPDPDVLARYRSAGTTVLRTGDVGAVSICTDGFDLQILKGSS